MKKTIGYLVVGLSSFVLGVSAHYLASSCFATHYSHKFTESIRNGNSKLKILDNQKRIICVIEADIKGFRDTTIYNSDGVVANVRNMIDGPASIMYSSMKVVSAKNGKEEINFINPDYRDEEVENYH